jgi:hypothetical protein
MMLARVPEDVGEDTEPARELRALRRLRHPRRQAGACPAGAGPRAGCGGGSAELVDAE